MVRSPVEICLGTRPSQAAKSRPLVNTSPAPIAATIALEMIGPIPGTLINRSQPASWRAIASISFDIPSTATGLVVVGELVGQGSAQEQAVVGDTPNLAARLQGLAEPRRANFLFAQ